jgi:hypothetical protein
MLTETLPCISAGQSSYKVCKKHKKIINLIDYLILYEGKDTIYVETHEIAHREALKIKSIYPLLFIEVKNNRIVISI